VMIRQVREPPRPPRELNPSIPEALEQVVLRCLAKSPKSRPQSAMELAQALTAAVGLDFDASGAFLEWKGWEGPSSHSAVEMPAVKVRAHRPSQVVSAVRNAFTARRRAMAAGGGLVLVGLATWLGLRGGKQGSANVASAMAAARPALAPLPMAQVLLQSTPAGADVLDEAGQRLGVTPHTLTLPAAGSKRVRLQRAGYQPAEQVVVRGDAPGGAVDVVLRALPRVKGKRPQRPSNAVARNRR
jgi:hypothetical protein